MRTAGSKPTDLPGTPGSGAIRAELAASGVVRFASFGVRFELTMNDDELVDRLAEVLPPRSAPTDAERPADALVRVLTRAGRRHLIAVDGHRLHEELTTDDALGLLRTTLHDVMAADAPGHVFVRAGAVAVDGRALLLPGPRFSGTSTLVRELVQRGAGLLSDEWAPLHADGRVHPADASADAEIGPVPVGVIATLAREPGATLALDPVTGPGAALGLVGAAPAARRHPARVMAAVRAATQGAVVATGVRGEAAEAAERLLALLDRVEG